MNTPIAVITGGSRGIGRATAFKLADRGIDVILTYRSAEAEAREVVEAIQAKGWRAKAIQLDVGDLRTHGPFVSAVEQQLAQWGTAKLDYVVNNAGIAAGAAFADTTEAQFDALFDTKIGLPDDIGGVVASLVSADNGWVTGQRIEVTGGYAL